MIYTIFKVALSAALVVLISEIAKRNTVAGALIASLPIVSILAFIWLYAETGDAQKVQELSMQIFWLVIPSLTLFVVLPVLIRLHLHFYVSLIIAMCATALAYYLLMLILKSKNIHF